MIETFYLKRVWARCWAWKYFSILSINLAWNFPDCIVQLKLQGAMCQLLWSPHPTQQRIIMWDMLPISQECFNGYQFQSLATLPAGILFRIDITKNIFNISKTIYLLRIDFLADCRYFRYMLQVTIITLLHDLLLPGHPTSGAGGACHTTAGTLSHCWESWPGATQWSGDTGQHLRL